MKPHVVADIGNTRIKWGRVAVRGSSIERTASLPDDPGAWEQQLQAWETEPLVGVLPSPTWVLASVQPRRCDRLREWLVGKGHRVVLLEKAHQLPLEVSLEKPDHVGIDRLLDAIAAKAVLPPGQGAVLIDAGSAVTVDWLDEEHRFRGGAIFPGFRLMTEALHNYTALLPLVTIEHPVPEYPGTSTPTAMQVGVFIAVAGAIREVVRRMAEGRNPPPQIFFTGGDAPLLVREMQLENAQGLLAPWNQAVHWPNQTLEGILHAVEGTP